jgi:hypothetical protein
MTASANFIKAAKTPGRRPIVSMKVEDVTGTELTVDTQTEWENSSVLTDISTTEIADSVIQQRYEEFENGFYQFQSCGGRTGGVISFVADGSEVITDVTLRLMLLSIFSNTTVDIQVSLYDANPYTVPSANLIASSSISSIYFAQFASSCGPYIAGSEGTGTFYFNDCPLLTPSSTYWLSVGESTAGPSIQNKTSINRIWYAKETGFVETEVFDFGVVPAGTITFNANDVAPNHSSIEYKLRGSTDNFAASDVDLGVVNDGDIVPTYRYYIVEITLSTTGGRAYVQSVGLSLGEFFELSTVPGQPGIRAVPNIKKNSVRALTSKLELMETAHVGDANVTLTYSKFVSDMIYNGRLKNKQVFLKLGYEGLSEVDYEPFFTGLWEDYKVDENLRQSGVKLRDGLKRFRKIKIPVETANASDVPTTSPFVKTGVNAIQVMIDIIDAIGIPDRFIDKVSFENLRDGALSSSNFNVTRTIPINNPQDGWELMNELAVATGTFLVPLPNGKITLILYDESQTPAVSIDAFHAQVSPLDGGQKRLFTRQLIRYNPSVSDPGEKESDYTNLHAFINSTSETAWNLEAEKRWFEKWDISSVAVAALALRMDGWFSNPKLTLTLSGLPMYYIDLTPGQIIGVSNLLVPSDDLDWPNRTEDRKFLILGKTVDPVKHMISLNLFEIGDQQNFAPTAYTITNANEPSSNTLTNAQTIDDIFLEVQEIVGQQWVNEFTFQPTEECHQILFFGYYDGSFSHAVYLEIYNYETLAWERVTGNITDFPTTDSPYYLKFDVPDPVTPYFDESSAGNETKIRIRHASNGSNNHFFYTDFIALRNQG